MIIPIKKLHPDAVVPTRANFSDAGNDLYAVESVDLMPGQRALVNTGISVAISPGYYGRVAPRSGLALKNGIDVLAGVVDASYRGPICVVLINLSNAPDDVFQVRPGMRIAQLIIERCEPAEWVVVDELPETKRAAGGFGSTGK